MKCSSRFGTLRGGIFFVVLTTMQAFGFTGHSTWQEVSSMHWSRATGVETPLTMASTSCGQASTQAWQPMQRSVMTTGCG
jgi:DNA-binding MltR family transcriptional regulator